MKSKSTSSCLGVWEIHQILHITAKGSPRSTRLTSWKVLVEFLKKKFLFLVLVQPEATVTIHQHSKHLLLLPGSSKTGQEIPSATTETILRLQNKPKNMWRNPLSKAEGFLLYLLHELGFGVWGLGFGVWGLGFGVC